MKKSFSFRRSWLEAINLIGDSALRAEITMIVVNYGLTGELIRSSNDMVNTIVSLITSQIPRRKESPENQTAYSSSPADTVRQTTEQSQPVSASAASQGIVVSDKTEPPVPEKRTICYRNPHYPDPLPAFAM